MQCDITGSCKVISEYSPHALLMHCPVPESIHTCPTEGIGISWQIGGSVRSKYLMKCMKLNWNFQRGGEVLEKITSMGKIMDVFWNYEFSLTFRITTQLSTYSQPFTQFERILKYLMYQLI